MSIKVIIADDHQLFIDGIKSILAPVNNITVIAEACNGFELIKHLENGLTPNLIITDIRMPVIDGVSATRALSKDFPEIPILALSMYDQSADVIEMLDAGAKGYITKNVERNELLTAIKTVIRGEYYFSKKLPLNVEDWKKQRVNAELGKLTKRENEILELIAKGRSTLEIAQQLKISKFTIDTHRKNIHKKLGIKSNAGLVNYALKESDLKSSFDQ
ncbi:response regulator [Carboxylicivirga linearis]|uniref:Response regulator transcription factor n=1 Tax=Carboxylicivirga linearis TaxID=1628157 RepID=A0ABS5JS52_9BACT|nr:response regulator transcription factor [Carboxylicivirga linearis]MBS2097226.1 response regulator transcription factor [Carboxylicivirga linearis]